MKSNTIQGCISTVDIRECVKQKVGVSLGLEGWMGSQHHMGDGYMGGHSRWRKHLSKNVVRWQKDAMWSMFWRNELPCFWFTFKLSKWWSSGRED